MLNQVNRPVNFKQRQGVFWVTLGYMMMTLVSTRAYASDLEIYQPPAQGQKTLIMMLDTSGSMGTGSISTDYNLSNCTVSSAASSTTPSYTKWYCTVSYSTSGTSSYQRLKNSCEVIPSNGGLKCYDRITRLKDGMFSVLDNTTDTSLAPIYMGVGNFSSNGDGSTGQILVPAAPLGSAGSAQRLNLKTAIAGLTANAGTPSAHAYAEAAAYLMGTKTSAFGTAYTIWKQQWYMATPGSTMTDRTTYYGKCVSWQPVDLNNGVQLCNQTLPNNTTVPYNSQAWQLYGTTSPITGITSTTTVNRSSNSRYSYTIYSTSYEIPNPTDSNSGFTYSVLNNQTYPGIINTAQTAYKSPLPARLELACGQGVYFLSDGQPNSSSTSEASAVMTQALTSSSFTPATFTCPTSGNYLPVTASDSAWNCMGQFAQKLYDKTTNPTNVKIQTAFVGFGADFSSLSTQDAINACRLGSRLKASTGVPSDTCSTDAGSATNTLRNPAGGYGNGVFVQALSPADVNASVNGFIQSLGDDVVPALITGSATVPIDDLNPNGFQPYGYLRQMEPNPAKTTQMLWRGNVKKYNLAGGALKDVSNRFVANTDGSLSTTSRDLWNPTTTDDGKQVLLGGAYSRVPMPVTGSTASINNLRPLWTDVGSVNTTTGALTPVSAGATLTNVVGVVSNATSDIPNRFGATTSGGVSPMKDLSLTQKKALINYLGYNLAIDATALPTTLTTPASPFLTMGGSVHAQPIQLSYSAALNSDGTLGTRTESVLYGSMEGALHLVDATTGVEQMVFVPSDILGTVAGTAVTGDTTGIQARGLRQGETDSTEAFAPTQGVDGPWVADPAYKTNKGSSLSTSSIVASRMNVYGGLRMSGSAWYGLNLLNKTSPKLLFRIDKNSSGFSNMGQTWSKPVLGNVRYNNVITRVMIVGGGYDPRYESPVFTGASDIKGNTVYMINATTGALIWQANGSLPVANTVSNMTHSVVSRIGTLDRDADGLIDSIYYGDLGGQVWRSDFNNTFGTTTANFGVRTVRLANLATTSGGSQVPAGKNPRFYEAPTLTVHSFGSKTFVLAALASGNRSSPIDVNPTALGGHADEISNAGLSPLLVNNVYGLIDRDAGRPDLITNTTTAMSTQNLTLANLQPNPQTTLTGVIGTAFFPTTGTGKDGWYRSLSSTSGAVEKADGTFRKPGGIKLVEDMVAVTGKLYLSAYDPEGTGVAPGNPCDPRVVGESDLQYYCLPYGVCLAADGSKDTSVNSPELGTGASFNGSANGGTNTNDNVIGAGIRGVVLGDKDTPTGAACKNMTLVGNQAGTGSWTCTRKLVQTLWYERKPDAAKVQ